MAKAVILKTDKGLMIHRTYESSNGNCFDADGCFLYCQDERGYFLERIQAFKLKSASLFLTSEPKMGELWYKDRESFIDIEIPWETNSELPILDTLLNIIKEIK